MLWLVLSIIGVVTLAWILDHREKKIHKANRKVNQPEEDRNGIIRVDRYTNDG